MAKTNRAGVFGAFPGRPSHRPRARAKRLSRAMVDLLEPRRLLAPWITTEVAGEVVPGSYAVEVVDDRAYAWASENAVTVLDVSGPGMPVQLARLDVAGGFLVSGSYLYVVEWNNLTILDASNLDAPTVVGSYTNDNKFMGMRIAGSYLYFTDAVGLKILDVSNPASPALAGSLAISITGSNGGVAVAGSYAYVKGVDLTVVNIADPAHPVAVGSCQPLSGGSGVAVVGSTAYTIGGSIIDIINVSNPSAPVVVSSWYLTGQVGSWDIYGSTMCVIEGNQVDVFDVSAPLGLNLCSMIPTWREVTVVSVWKSRMYLVRNGILQIYNVANPWSPGKIYEWAPPGPDCVAFSGTIAYTNGALNLFDIRNFDKPNWLGSRSVTGWIYDMVVSGSYLYAAEQNAFEIFDISTPSDPFRVGAWTAPGSEWMRGIVIYGSYAYIATTTWNYGSSHGGFNGLRVFNIASPSAPSLVGQYAIPQTAAQDAWDVAVSGTVAYVAGGNKTLRIIDVSNPASMVELGSVVFPSIVDHVLVGGSRVYVGGYDGSYIVDVSNPVAPVVLNSSIPRAVLALSGNLAYTYNSILDVSDPAAIRQVGECAAYSIAFYGDSRALVANGHFETVRFRIGENEPATDITLSHTSIAENRSWVTVVGTLSSTCLNPTKTFTYRLASGTGSTDNSCFTISGNQLKTNYYVFDYEYKSSYSIRIRSTDAAGQWIEKALTISVIDMNELPTNISLSANSVVEHQPVGTVVGTVSSSDPDVGSTFTYSLVSGTGDVDNASFTISGNQLLTAASFDYHTKSSYSIRVRTTDQGGMWYEKTFTISVTADTSAPTVTAVYVRGSTWSSNYLSFLAANLAGSSATYGYAIPAGSGAAQLQTLPWRNLNRISIGFSEDVSIAQAQFAIVGSVGSYSVSGFAYSSIDHVATWSLSAAIGPDKLYVAVPGTGTSPITDLAANVLDGEWVNPTTYGQVGSTDSFPSGNGVAGGDFAFRFDVLPGDSSGGSLGKVNVADTLQTKGRSGLPVTLSTYRSDFDGNGAVNVADVLYVRSKSSIYSLPVNPPVVPVFGPISSQVGLLQASSGLIDW